MYLLNKSLQFSPTILTELYYRISERYANTCRPGGVCQTTHSLAENVKYIEKHLVRGEGEKFRKIGRK